MGPMSEDIYDEYPSLTLAKETLDQNIEPLSLASALKISAASLDLR